MTILSPNERELLQVLVDDVNLIERALAQGVPQPHELRASFSPILRRWLVEDQLGRVLRLIRPHALKFSIVGNAWQVNLCKSGYYEHWMGLMVIGSLGVGTAQVSAAHLDEKAPPPGTQAPTTAMQSAKHFSGQQMFYWRGEFYTRVDVIRWLANKFGGAHLDFRRQADEQHVDEIRNYFGVEITEPNNLKMLIGQEVADGRSDMQRRQRVYDAADMIALDTARIFAEGVRSSIHAIHDLLSRSGITPPPMPPASSPRS